jgi:hypothetical protein
MPQFDGCPVVVSGCIEVADPNKIGVVGRTSVEQL